MATPEKDPLCAHAEAAPERAAVIEGDRVVTYGEFNAVVNQLANGLLALGIVPGDRVAWCGPNSCEVLQLVQAARKIRLVAVPVAYRFTGDEMRYVVENSGARAFIVDAEYADVAINAAASLSELREIIVFRGENSDPRAWSEVLALGGPEEPQLPAQTEKFGAQMSYTSGTTGKPKGALRTRSDPELLGVLIELLRIPSGGQDVHITTGPLYHAGPLSFASLTHTMGNTVVVLRRFDGAEWLRLVAEHRVNSTFSAPIHLKRIVSVDPGVIAAADLSSLRTLIANAAPVPYALKQEVIEKLGDGFLFEVYGSTELGINTVLEPEDQLRKPGSCGKAYGTTRFRITADDGSECEPGVPGELFVRSTFEIDGYHATTEQLADIGDGWKSVGDIAYLDGEGFLFVCDRKKDMIISGGVNIYPAEIEAVLHEHPDVLDVAVFGVPDDEWGERVHAVVQAKSGHTLDETDLAAFSRNRLAGYKCPTSWDMRDELPRTESGKLLKRILRDERWNESDSNV